MAKGLRIAKPGYSANDAEPKNRVYDSNFNTFKYVRYQVLRFLVSDTTPKVYTIAHGLGYAPSTLCYALAATSSGEYAMQNSSTDQGTQTVLCEADKTNVYVTVYTAATTPDMDIIVLIGADDLADIGS